MLVLVFAQLRDRAHVVALAMGTLLARAVTAFLTEPLGDVPPLAKYSHNIAFLLGATLLGLWALSRNAPAGDSDRRADEQPMVNPSY